MFTAPSAAFLKEFTIYADRIVDEQEQLIVTRSNEKNIVIISLAEYNDLKKQLYKKNS